MGREVIPAVEASSSRCRALGELISNSHLAIICVQTQRSPVYESDDHDGAT